MKKIWILIALVCCAGCMSEEARKEKLEKCRNDQWYEISQTFPLAMKAQGLDPEQYSSIKSAFGTRNFDQMRSLAREKNVFSQVMRAYDLAFEMGIKAVDCSQYEPKK